jgi:ubiquinone/menaquinone biosynthesis C-methylase UbiE
MATTSTPATPNHHAAYPGCTGFKGVFAGLTMAVGRTGDARLAVELTGTRPDDRVVDVGCGPGTAARFAARLGAQVTGVDPSPAMLGLARRLTRSSVSVTWLDGGAESLPLPDGSATVVWTVASVHHWQDVDAGLREVRRVLVPGGRFLAMERPSKPGATGYASHGWTDEQAATFADMCRDHGFDGVEVSRHSTRLRRLVAVRATVPEAAPT